MLDCKNALALQCRKRSPVRGGVPAEVLPRIRLRLPHLRAVRHSKGKHDETRNEECVCNNHLKNDLKSSFIDTGSRDSHDWVREAAFSDEDIRRRDAKYPPSSHSAIRI